MKRKIYFLISSLLMIVSSLKAILYADDIVANMIEQAGLYPGDIGERITNLFQNSGNIYVLSLAIITIIINGVIIGMNSVVTKNVPDYAIVAGNPARIIRENIKVGKYGVLINEG